MICSLPDIEGLLVYNIQGETFEVVCNVEISFYWDKLMTYRKGERSVHAGNSYYLLQPRSTCGVIFIPF